MSPRPLLPALLLCSLPATVAAQEATDLVAFRPGQWGVQFAVESPFAGAGAIVFTSPTSAWTLDATAAFSSTSERDPQSLDADHRTVGGNLDLGRRYYRAPRGRVAGFFGLGISGRYSHSRFSRSSTTVSTVNRWGGGVFGELGAQVHVTPYLSLGAAWPIRVQVSRYTSESRWGGFKGTDWNVSAGTLRLRGGLYF